MHHAELKTSLDSAAFDTLAGLLRYVGGDWADPATFDRLRQELAGAKRPLHYLAIPPVLFGAVVEALGASGCARGARVVVEKPFGAAPGSAQGPQPRPARRLRRKISVSHRPLPGQGGDLADTGNDIAALHQGAVRAVRGRGMGLGSAMGPVVYDRVPLGEVAPDAVVHVGHRADGNGHLPAAPQRSFVEDEVEADRRQVLDCPPGDVVGFAAPDDVAYEGRRYDP